MVIRPLVTTDIPLVAHLLRTLALEYILHESSAEGASTFLAENNESGLRGFVARGHVYHVALAGEELAGFVAVRDDRHLFHLFVDKRWHGRGLARRLWETARTAAIARGGGAVFTVNASNFAVPMYEALGFVRTAPTQCTKGLYYNPMRLGGDS